MGVLPFRRRVAGHGLRVTSLDAGTLPSLSREVSRPFYDRGRVRTGVVHLGVGGFHRSHQAMYLDRLMEAGSAALDWGICGVGVLPADRALADAMTAQDCLYTLVVKHPDGSTEARVIGSLVEYLLAPDDPDAVVEKMADPATRIVSLTVTEGGYNASAITGEFDETNPEVLGDLQPGAALRTSFGLVTEALVRRRARGLPRSPSSPATTSRATGTWPVAATRLSPRCGTRSWGSGCGRRCPSRTRWSTGSRR